MKPDSYVRLGLGEYEDSYFVEVDRGTEGSATIGRKLKEYVAYEATRIEQSERGVFPRVLWLTLDEDRSAALAASIGRLPKGSRELFAVACLGDAATFIEGTSSNTIST